jgi:hypothetical protein
MNIASDHAFFVIARMHKDIRFIPLVDLLKNNGGLHDSIHSCAGEKILIFIFILCGNSMRNTKSKW